MTDFLARMTSASRQRVHAARRREPEGMLRRRALHTPVPRPLVLSKDGFDLIAEIKPSSPSRGALASPSRPLVGAAVERALAYAAGGAAAISVLTEPSAFGGSLELLEAIARASTVPAMRKDFITAPYQLYESRLAGASGVLLIVRALDTAALDELLDVAGELSLFAMLEAFDEADLARIDRVRGRVAGRLIVGLNARDLESLRVETTRFASLARAFPAGCVRIAESGFERVDDSARAARLGYHAALVGEALMRSDDPRAMTTAWILAGRGALRRLRVPR